MLWHLPIIQIFSNFHGFRFISFYEIYVYQKREVTLHYLSIVSYPTVKFQMYSLHTLKVTVGSRFKIYIYFHCFRFHCNHFLKYKRYLRFSFFFLHNRDILAIFNTQILRFSDVVLKYIIKYNIGGKWMVNGV